MVSDFIDQRGILTVFRRTPPPAGSSPGTLLAPAAAEPTRMYVFDYTTETASEFEVSDLSDVLHLKDTASVTWVDVQGLSDTTAISRLGEMFGLHSLTIADIVNAPARPKVEDHDDYLFIISSGAEIIGPLEIKTEQISIILGKHFVLSIQERSGDNFEPIRNRIRQKQGMIRKAGADHLACALLDAIIDSHYPCLELIGDRLEDLEDDILEHSDKESLRQVYHLRRQLIALRRSIWPQREVLSYLIREENKLLKKPVRAYFRDSYDHCVQIIDVTETFREMCSDLSDVYLSSLSNRMNEIMKVLTVISTIFIPLSFFAGVYGMNFRHMPELELTWTYPLFWILTITCALSMLVLFRRCGWIGSSASGGTPVKNRK